MTLIDEPGIEGVRGEVRASDGEIVGCSPVVDSIRRARPCYLVMGESERAARRFH